MTMERTVWCCDACRASGLLHHDSADSVYDVIAKLAAEHAGHDLAIIRDCKFGVGRVRVMRASDFRKHVEDR